MSKIETETNKKLIVLIHGWGGTMDSLAGLEKELESEETKIVKLELPGFGNTLLSEVYDLNKYSEWLSSQLKELNIPADTEVTLVGHSVGGKILMNSLKDSSLPEGYEIVLINSSGIKPKNSLKKTIFKFITTLYFPIKFTLRKLGLGGIQNFLQKAFYKFIVRARDYEKLNDKPLLKETFKNIINEHVLPETLTKVNNKILLIWGENDPITKVWMGNEIHKNLPNSEFEIVLAGTHGLPLKQPKLIAKIIKDWQNH